MSLEGQLLNRYQLLHLIGSGGMGEVYLAEDTLIQRQVAIKVIHTDEPFPVDPFTVDSTTAPEVVHSFLREARIIARLDHPHILPLLDYGEDTTSARPLAYMVMPFPGQESRPSSAPLLF